MVNFKLRWGFIAAAMLCSAPPFLVCSTALAQNPPVNGFVIINPISVCSGGVSAAQCAPFGVSCTSATGTQVCTQFNDPSRATVNTPIGFVDVGTNVNLTRAFWAQAGIDVVFFPVQSYISPSNTIPSSWNNIKDVAPTNPTLTTFTYTPTTYQTLHLVSVPCAKDGFIALTSPDFQALTQHSVCTEHGGLASTYSKLVNPPLAPFPAPPLAINGCGGSCSPNSNAIDMFFVNSYSGTGVTLPSQFGFSWINGDGASIGKTAFSPVPRFDTVAHEIGHALVLDHLSFGANTDQTNTPVGNMMLLGSTRATSSKSGCQPTTVFPTNIPPVYAGGALFDLDYSNSSFIPCGTTLDVNGIPIPNGKKLADHLTLQSADPTSVCSSPLDRTTCKTQEGAAALSPFINKTLPNTVTANAGGGSPFTSAMTTSISSSSGTPAPLIMTISVDGSDPDVPDLASSIIALPPNDPLSFGGNSPVTQIGGTQAKDATGPCDATHPTNCAVTVTSVTKLTNQTLSGNPGCDSGTGQPPSSQCIKMTYSVGPNHGFGPDNPAINSTNSVINVQLAVNFNKDPTIIINNSLLAGAQYTAVDSKGFATTSLFGNDSTANSQIPDLTTPNVMLKPGQFENATVVNLINSDPTTDPKVLRKRAQCTPPYVTVFQKIKGQLVPETVCPDGNLPTGD